jgi:hypothetical protein
MSIGVEAIDLVDSGNCIEALIIWGFLKLSATGRLKIPKTNINEKIANVFFNIMATYRDKL